MAVKGSLLLLQEFAMRIRSSIDNSDGTFYTDLNGFQLTRRKTYSKIPLQGNFYPMPTSAVLQDDSNRLTLCTRQPLGVGALEKGMYVCFAIFVFVCCLLLFCCFFVASL